MNTRQIVIDAAFALFNERRFEKIKVQDILDRAQVSRKTFYRLFRDKYELMHLYYADYVNRNLMTHYDGNNLAEIFAGIFDFAREHESFFNNVYKTEGEDSFWKFLHRYSYDFYKSVITRNTGRETISEEEHYIIVGICHGGINIFKEYIKKDSRLTSKEMGELICRIIPEEYRAVVKT